MNIDTFSRPVEGPGQGVAAVLEIRDDLGNIIFSVEGAGVMVALRADPASIEKMLARALGLFR